MMLLDDAAAALAVPAGHILRIMPTRLRRRSDNQVVGDFFEIAKKLRCPDDVAKAVAAGTEWLMSDLDIERLYGCDYADRMSIARVPVFTPTPYASVWRVTPFVSFLSLSPQKKRWVLQGKKFDANRR